MVRTTVVHALVLTAAVAATLTPCTCLGDVSNELPTKATKEVSPELISLFREKKMPKHSPILVRIFKEESELEVWKQDANAMYSMRNLPRICREPKNREAGAEETADQRGRVCAIA